jgi:hypothetical protein
LRDGLLNKENINASFNNFIEHYYFSWANGLLKYCGKHIPIFLGLINKWMINELDYIETSERTSGRLQENIIKENSKDFYDIYLKYKKKRSKKLLRFINKVSKKLINREMFRTLSKNPFDYPLWMRKYHKKFILDTLQYNKLLTKKLINEQGLEKVLKRFFKGDDRFFLFISSLLSIEVFLRKMKEVAKNE